MNASPDMQRVGATISASVRDNPIGTALLGTGLMWLIASRTRAPEFMGRAFDATGDAFATGASTVGRAAESVGQSAARLGSAAANAISETAAAATQTMQQATGRLQGAAGDVVNDGWDMARHTADLARKQSGVASFVDAGQVRAARDWLSRAFDQQPLLLAAGGLALGAAIAATVPLTDVEKRTIGGTARDLADKATDLAHEGVEVATYRVRDVARAAMQEAERQGLTPEQLAEQTRSAANKASGASGGATCGGRLI